MSAVVDSVPAASASVNDRSTYPVAFATPAPLGNVHPVVAVLPVPVIVVCPVSCVWMSGVLVAPTAPSESSVPTISPDHAAMFALATPLRTALYEFVLELVI